jgi:hypothetical protein
VVLVVTPATLPSCEVSIVPLSYAVALWGIMMSVWKDALNAIPVAMPVPMPLPAALALRISIRH